MKLIRFLSAVVALAATNAAMAGTQSPQALGAIDAILRYCSEIDKHDAAKFEQIWQGVSGTKSDLNTYSGGADFQASFDAVHSALESQPHDKSALTCASAVSSPKNETDDDSRRKPAASKRS